MMRILAACGNCNGQYDVSGQKAGAALHCHCGGLIVVPELRAQEARLVRCQSCGAVRGSGGLNCEFCGARFSTVDQGWGSMCPKCFCRLPTDAQFCVECGLKISPQKLEAIASELLCPRCVCALQGRFVAQIEVYECVACAGLWVPAGTFESICQNAEARSQALSLAGMGGKRRRFELTDEEQVKYVPCPACRNLMNRYNFASISGVIIDVCRNHGVWLDNQELNRIVRFIESGGLEKAREFGVREREHSERMRTRTVVPAAVSFEPLSGREPDLLDRGACVLGRMIVEIGKAFFAGL